MAQIAEQLITAAGELRNQSFFFPSANYATLMEQDYSSVLNGGTWWSNMT
jgi:hypothetical protein